MSLDIKIRRIDDYKGNFLKEEAKGYEISFIPIINDAKEFVEIRGYLGRFQIFELYPYHNPEVLFKLKTGKWRSPLQGKCYQFFIDEKLADLINRNDTKQIITSLNYELIYRKICEEEFESDEIRRTEQFVENREYKGMRLAEIYPIKNRQDISGVKVYLDRKVDLKISRNIDSFISGEDK